MESFDVFVVSGSENGVYEDLQWIRKLEDYIRELDLAKKKMIGICFGHQVIGHALGGKVIQNPNGIEISWHSFNLSKEGKEIFTGREDIKLLYCHGDIVIDPPSDLISLGGNSMTQHQGFYRGNNVFTLQGHPEFTPEILEFLLGKYYNNNQEKGKLHFSTVHNETDRAYIVDVILKYLQLL